MRAPRTADAPLWVAPAFVFFKRRGKRRASPKDQNFENFLKVLTKVSSSPLEAAPARRCGRRPLRVRTKGGGCALLGGACWRVQRAQGEPLSANSKLKNFLKKFSSLNGIFVWMRRGSGLFFHSFEICRPLKGSANAAGRGFKPQCCALVFLNVRRGLKFGALEGAELFALWRN